MYEEKENERSEDEDPNIGVLNLSQILNKVSEQLGESKKSMKKSKRSMKSEIPNGNVIRKRPMFRLAEIDKIFGEKADMFFMGSVETINQEVKHMNHATRYWLGVKFFG